MPASNFKGIDAFAVSDFIRLNFSTMQEDRKDNAVYYE